MNLSSILPDRWQDGIPTHPLIRLQAEAIVDKHTLSAGDMLQTNARAIRFDSLFSFRKAAQRCLDVA